MAVALTYMWTMPAQSGLSPSRCMMAASSSAAFSFFLTTDLPMYSQRPNRIVALAQCRVVFFGAGFGPGVGSRFLHSLK